MFIAVMTSPSSKGYRVEDQFNLTIIPIRKIVFMKIEIVE